MEANVGVQSTIWKRPSIKVPSLVARRGEWRKVTALVPPSHSVPLVPLRGKLDAECPTLPPLSVVNTTRVLSYWPVCLSVCRMSPTLRSMAASMAR